MKTFEEMADDLWDPIKVGQEYEDIFKRCFKISDTNENLVMVNYSSGDAGWYTIRHFIHLFTTGVIKKL